LPEVDADRPGRGASVRSFFVLARDGDPSSPSNYREVPARLRALGRHVQVYVDEESLALAGDESLRRLVRCFDDEIWPRAAVTFGTARDVDGDGVVTILLTRALRDLGALDGAMRGADLDARVAPPLGNRCDLLLLNSDLPSGPYRHSVIAHEYMHAVLFSRRLDRAGPASAPVEEESWLDEAIAHLAEDAHGYSRGNITHRVERFLAQPEAFRVVVDDYYAAKLFRSHGHRGAAYLFIRWCADTFGPGMVQRLVDSPERGIANLQRGTAWSFEDLYRAWTHDLFFQTAARPPDGVPGARPATTTLDRATARVTWRADGTAPRYFIVASQGSQAVEVQVLGPESAPVQVTVIPLGDDWSPSSAPLNPRPPVHSPGAAGLAERPARE
jgi:hypothetical protein